MSSPCSGSRPPRGASIASLAAAVAVAIVVATGCGPETDTTGATGATADPGADRGARRDKALTLVEVCRFRVGEIHSTLVDQTDVESDLEVDVFPKVGPAYVKAVMVEEGDAVKAGDPLLLLNDVDFELEKRRRESLWRQSQASEQQAAQKLKESQAKARAQKAQFEKAKNDLKRALDAQSGGIEVMSGKELQDAQSEFERNEAEMEALDLAIEWMKTEAELTKLQTQAARIELDSAEKDLIDCVVRAPHDSVVQRKHVNPGLLIGSNTHCFTLVDPTRLRTYLAFPQEDLAAVAQIGLPVAFELKAFPGREFIGHVESVNPAVDPSSGTVRLRARFGQDAIGVVRPGMYAMATIVVDSREQAVLMRKRAIVHLSDKTWFFRHENGVARRCEFKGGAEAGDEIEVLAVDGAPPDLESEIILVGQDRLRDGDPVQVASEPR